MANTPSFTEPATWQLAYSYTCEHNPDHSGTFGIVVNNPVIYGPPTTAQNLPAQNSKSNVAIYNDLAGTFTINVVSTCQWIIDVGPNAEPIAPPYSGCTQSLPGADWNGRAMAMAQAAGGTGYWITDPSGDLASCGSAIDFTNGGSVGVGTWATAATPDGLGLWTATAWGEVTAWGTAVNYGELPFGTSWSGRIIGMAADPATGGYWLLGNDGGVFAFHAPFLGSLGGVHLNQPVVGIEATPDGKGYRIVAADGGVFDFGDAHFYGSTGGIRLNQPIVGIASDPITGGYWLVAADGGVFSFHAPFYGSTGGIQIVAPCIGMTAMPDGRGYRFVAADGGIFDFGDAPFEGSAVS